MNDATVVAMATAMATVVDLRTECYGVNYFVANTPIWLSLYTDGTRVFSQTISFPQAFLNTPIVHLSLCSPNVIKLDLQVQSVTTNGFTFQVISRDADKIMGFGISWIAVSL